MSIIDKALEANRNYATTYDAKLGKCPAPMIAVVTRMVVRVAAASVNPIDHKRRAGLTKSSTE
jgi:NADPH:quinone reductase-like Zn-dependent oxidoreductase